MRRTSLPSLACAFLVGMLLGGCTPGPWAAVAGVEMASVTLFGRGIVDIGVSAVTGRDCSIVRLDRGKTYCAAPDVPAPEILCARTLGVVDCWPGDRPTADTLRGRDPVGDTPPPRRAQTEYGLAPWPKALTTRP